MDWELFRLMFLRETSRELKGRGIDMLVEADEGSTSPATFMINDPDGNTILFDQHV